MKKLVFIFALIFCCVFAAQSQSSYKSAIGLRLGVPISISFKHFISEPGAIELFAGFRNYGGFVYNYGWFNAGGLYQHHFPIESVAGLKWYVGGGAAAYFWHYDDGFLNPGSNISIGILGNLGLDYKFADLPINLSADWVPAVFVNGYGSGFGAGYGALSARYTFN